MRFVCQIVLFADLFGDIEGRMAHVFVTDYDGSGVMPETWGPESAENAVIIQPDGL
jgi:hypothetical protein